MRVADPRPIVLTILREGLGLSVGLTDMRAAGHIARVEAVETLLEELRRRAPAGALRELGGEIFARFLPDPVREFLAASPARQLCLQISESVMHVPWEIAHDGTGFLGDKFRLSRQIVSSLNSPPPPARPARDALKVLLVDAEPLARRLAAIEGLAVTSAQTDDLNRARALKLIGEHDVVHFAPGQGRVPIPLREVAALPSPPQLVICERGDAGLAVAACMAGLNIVLGDAHDGSGADADSLQLLYAELARGAALGEAARRARAAPGEGRLRVGPLLYGDAAQALVSRVERVPREDNRRQVTIMSCDIVDSTHLLQTHGDEKWSDVLDAYRARCAMIVAGHDGYIEEAKGDDILCLFGFPIAHEDSASRCLKAAHEILDAVADLGIQLRIGIATGQVAVGGGRPVGDVVHFTTRLRQSADAGAILVSDSTRRIVRDRFVFRVVARKLELKGFPDSGPVYRVLSQAGAAAVDPFEGAHRLTPFVGRAEELQQLEQHWAATRGGPARTVLVSGEAGIGKSRLAREFRRSLSVRGHHTIECRCAPDHANSAFHPVIEYLLRFLEIRPGDRVEDKLGKIGRMMASRADFEDGAPLIAELLSIPFGSRYPRHRYSAEKQRQLTLDILVDWIKRGAEKAPLCLIVEDLHWIDPSTKELLARLLVQAAPLPLMVLVTVRSEAAPGWAPGAPAHELQLKGVSVDAARAMVIGACGDIKLPGEVVRLLAARADGVPLFIEESTKMALDVRAGAEAIAALRAVPVTLHDLLMARLDRLASAKYLAQVGGTIGREFSAALLEAVLKHETSPIRIEQPAHRLGALVDSGLLLEKGEPASRSYVFKHALVRDAAYQSLWERDRRRLHRTIATVIGEQFSELGERQPELLAYHYTEAGHAAEAIAFWEKAARRAASLSAHDEAISHLTKGLELLTRMAPAPERDATELRFQLLLAGRLIATRGYGAELVERVYSRASELCRVVGDESSLLKVRLGLEGYHFMRANFEKAHEFADQAAAMVARSPDPARRHQSQWAMGNILFHQGEGATALQYWDACLAEYDKGQHRPGAVQDPGVMCLCYSAWLKWQLGHPDQALQRADQVVALATELNHPFSMGEAYGFRTAVLHFRGESALALKNAQQAIAICEENGFAVWLAHARLMHGRIVAELGDPAAGVEEMRQAYEMWTATGAVVTRPFYLAQRAEGLALAGRADEGLSVMESAFETVRKYGERYHEAEIRRLVGELILQSAALHGRDRAGEAERWFLGALEFARSRKFRSMELRSATSLARLWLSQGRGREAAQVLEPVYGWFDEGKKTGDLVKAQALLEELRRVRV